jgi:transcriptional regulator with XRE-family HTH domain
MNQVRMSFVMATTMDRTGARNQDRDRVTFAARTAAIVNSMPSVVGENLLGEFLKARRALLRPQDAGLPEFGRRRVSGLRRDELALLAGVSEAYLVRLEQGRDRHPSEQVLDALARALQLDADTTAHLHLLARRTAAPARPRRRRGSERVAPGTQALLDAWSGMPAYLIGRRVDVLASNRLAVALSPFYRPGGNLVRAIFRDDEARSFFVDWEAVARQAVASLRAAAGADVDDPALTELVGELSLHSEDFRRLWARHDARPTTQQVKRLLHPLVGPLELRRHALSVAGADGQLMLAYQPAPGSPSERALALLATLAAEPSIR